MAGILSSSFFLRWRPSLIRARVSRCSAVSRTGELGRGIVASVCSPPCPLLGFVVGCVYLRVAFSLVGTQVVLCSSTPSMHRVARRGEELLWCVCVTLLLFFGLHRNAGTVKIGVVVLHPAVRSLPLRPPPCLAAPLDLPSERLGILELAALPRVAAGHPASLWPACVLPALRQNETTTYILHIVGS